MAKRRASSATLIQSSRRAAPEVKAMIHQIIGAGRSHVKREFLGLTDDDARDIERRLGDLAQLKIDRL